MSMFNRFSHQKAASQVFHCPPEVDNGDGGDSSDTISWSGSAPSSPKSPISAPVTTIPETPPQNLCRVSTSASERHQRCAGVLTPNNGSSRGLRVVGEPTRKLMRDTMNGTCAGVEASKTAATVVHNVESDTDSDATDCESVTTTTTTTGAAAGASAAAEPSCYVMQLVDMFPDAEQADLQSTLEQCDGDMEAAVQKLLVGPDPSSAPLAVRASKRPRRLASSGGDSDGVIGAPSQLTSRKRSRRIASNYSDSEKLEEAANGAGQQSAVASSASSPPRRSQGRRLYIELSDDETDPLNDSSFLEEDCDPWVGMHKEPLLNFLNTAKSSKLRAVMTASHVKVVRIMRPFASWDSMTESLGGTKISLERFLPKVNVFVKDLLVMQALMEKCQRVSKRLSALHELVEGKDDSSLLLPPPSILNSSMTLTQYQRLGLSWMAQLYKEEVNGILADEMGLGKTVQAIAFLAYLMETGVKGPFLIVVPSSTIDNWKREIALWCPVMDEKLMVYRGSQAERAELQEDVFSYPEDYTVFLTSYSTCTGAPLDRKFLRRRHASLCVLDEGHMLKNMMSQRYASMSRVCPGRRLLLTGTPLQNNLTELLSLLHFTMPDIFSPTQECIRRLFSAVSKSDEKGDGSVDGDDVDKIARTAHHIMQPFVLRRLKADVLKHLPPKQQSIIRCALPQRQRELYRSRIDAIKEDPSLNSCGSLMELRKVACHPLLVRSLFTDAKLKDMARRIYDENPSHYDVAKVEEDMTIMSDFELHKLCLERPSVHEWKLSKEDILLSAKFQELDKLLPEFKAKGSRVLLFSQFVIMLNIVEVFMNMRGYRFIRLDGSTSVSERQALIDQYNTNSDIFVFLLSTKAGGLGINLTSADVAILHDIDHNPHNDRQAEDRCHRVGQTKTVTVVRLLCQNTVDEVMMRINERKLKLEKDVTLTDADSNETPEDATALLSEAFKM